MNDPAQIPAVRLPDGFPDLPPEHRASALRSYSSALLRLAVHEWRAKQGWLSFSLGMLGLTGVVILTNFGDPWLTPIGIGLCCILAARVERHRAREQVYRDQASIVRTLAEGRAVMIKIPPGA